MLLQGWFYFTPIVFPMAALPERVQEMLRWNPLTPLVGLYRGALLGGSLGEPRHLLPLVVAAVGAFALGWFVFQRLERDFADEL